METQIQIRTSNKYNNRLLKLADSLIKLEENNPDKKYQASEHNDTIEHFDWAIELIPDKWKDNIELNGQIFSGLRKNEVLYKLALHFNLTVDECFHCFVPQYQLNYLGSMLDSNATPSELAITILELVRFKEAEHSEPVYEFRIGKKEKQYKKYLSQQREQFVEASDLEFAIRA